MVINPYRVTKAADDSEARDAIPGEPEADDGEFAESDLPEWAEVDAPEPPDEPPNGTGGEPSTAPGTPSREVIPIGSQWRGEPGEPSRDDRREPRRTAPELVHRDDPRAAAQIYYEVRLQDGADKKGAPPWRIHCKRTMYEVAKIIGTTVSMERASYQVIEHCPRRLGDPRSFYVSHFFFVNIPEMYDEAGAPKREYFPEPTQPMDEEPQSELERFARSQTKEPAASDDVPPWMRDMQGSLAKLQQQMADQEGRRRRDEEGRWRPSDWVGLAAATAPAATAAISAMLRPRQDNTLDMLTALIALSKDVGRPGIPEMFAMGLGYLPHAVGQLSAAGQPPSAGPHASAQPGTPPLPAAGGTHRPLPEPRRPAADPAPPRPTPNQPATSKERTPSDRRRALWRRLAEATRAGQTRRTMPAAYAARIVEEWPDDALREWLTISPEDLAGEGAAAAEFGPAVTDEVLADWVATAQAAARQLIHLMTQGQQATDRAASAPADDGEHDVARSGEHSADAQGIAPDEHDASAA